VFGGKNRTAVMERQQWTPWNAGGTFSLYNVAVVCVGV